MEFKIIDLMDEVEDSMVPIAVFDAASVSQIKSLTMAKIEKSKNKVVVYPKKRKRISLSVLAAVIVVLSMLIATVSASSDFRIADWFGDFFGVLTPGQEDAIDDLNMIPLTTGEKQADHDPVVQPQVSVASNGSKVTMLAAVGDAKGCYIKLRVEAPEGTVLAIPDEDEGFLQLAGDYLNYDENGRVLGILRNDSYRGGYTYDLIWTDPVPGDHMLEVVIDFVALNDLRFDDGVQKQLVIDGIWLQDQRKEYTQVLEGPWSFELSSSAPEAYYLNVEGKKIPLKYNSVATIDYLKVSSMGLEYRFAATPPQTDKNIDGCEPHPMVILKDGTEVKLRHGTAENLGRGVVRRYFTFGVPVDLDSIDYIQLENVKIPYHGNTLPPDYTPLELEIQPSAASQTVTSNGTTVKLLSAAGMMNQCYMTLQVEAPAGTLLALPEQGSLQLEQDPETPTILQAEDYYQMGYGYIARWEDRIPGDNILTVYLEMTLRGPAYLSFVDGVEKLMTIPGIYCNENGSIRQILEGPWQFDLTNCSYDYYDLLTEEKTMQAEDGSTVTLIDVEICPDSLMVWYEHETAGASIACDYVLVLKDGTEIRGRYPTAESDESHPKRGFVNFERTVGLSEIEYIRFGDLIFGMENAQLRPPR